MGLVPVVAHIFLGGTDVCYLPHQGMHRETPGGFLNGNDMEEKSHSHGSQHYRRLSEELALCLGPRTGMEEEEKGSLRRQVCPLREWRGAFGTN